jgi:Stigma-specific protein, Stig1
MRVAAFAAKTAFGLGLLLLASWNLPLAVADCPGGCGSGQPSSSCCVVTAPDGTQQCFGGCSGSTPKACCPGGFTAGCGAADSCCTSAECTGGQICQVTDKPYATCSCPAGKTLCGGQCTNTMLDFNNCGGCGNVCPASTDKCCAGQCVSCPIRGECVGDEPKCACPPDRPSICVLGGTSLAACFNLKTGDQGTGFCGTCGFTCPEGQDCCNGVCQNLQDDPANCGRCGLLCTTAPGGNPACCHGNCVDLNHDAANCGHCRLGCGPAQRCINGVCKGGPPCQGGRCDPSCTCPLPGETCVRGLCSLPQ